MMVAVFLQRNPECNYMSIHWLYCSPTSAAIIFPECDPNLKIFSIYYPSPRGSSKMLIVKADRLF